MQHFYKHSFIPYLEAMAINKDVIRNCKGEIAIIRKKTSGN